jgi:tRNA(Ile)-lysidine synthase
VKVHAPLVAKVRQALDRLGVGPGNAIVAVSGGPDSVTLLRALLALRDARPAGPLVIAHLNHQLRGAESDQDEAFVRDLHAALRAGGNTELEFRCARLDMATEATGENLEARARRVRYAWLADQARAHGLRIVLTGHTADDQAETVLHRLIRGTGLQGLRGIAVCRPLDHEIDVIRPLLTVTRAEVLAYLEAEGQAYHVDSSNADRRYTRNRIRHELLPLLAGYNPSIAEVLRRLAEQAEEHFQHTEAEAGRLLGEVELPRAGSLLIFDRQRLANAPHHLVRETFRLAWAREGWPLGGMGFDEWTRLIAVAQGSLTAAEFPGRIRARAHREVVQVGRGC